MKKNKKLSKQSYTKMYMVLGIAITLLTLYNLIQTYSFDNLLDQKIAEAKENARPSMIELKIITTKSCSNCYDINIAVDFIESLEVNVTDKETIDFSSNEAKTLISRYNIEKLPTVIITGETDKSTSLANKLKQVGEEKGGGIYVFTNLEPPFIETSTGTVRGEISLTKLKKDPCEDCFDTDIIISQLSGLGLTFKEQKTVDIDSSEGKNLINKYEIKKVPTFIMDKEAEVYPNLVQGWTQLGTVENDGSFVMRSIIPLYYSIEEKRIKGSVDITFLVDNTCENCYDPEIFHGPILEGMGIVSGSEKTLDISSEDGKDLVEKYEIEKVPALLLEGDVEEYSQLVAAWESVGTIETDGVYIFRKVEIAGQVYKDLTTNQVIEPSSG